jgi:hypothetical protein
MQEFIAAQRNRRREATAHKEDEAGTDIKMQKNPHRSAQKMPC